ncbi:MAG: translation initiation factor IF-2 [Candidatus Pacebacteria bacterium]|nr:translation initiation factor IF-2 [Candidatus Paceibacterota bacterium]
MAEKNNTITRQPVVVIMGHVDHGKSSLLEAIREDFVITSKESGGITQHIGAYEADFQGKRITFIDTPGHEAFSAMRQRGANAADIAILVVDAVEGVKPQTKEALDFIKKAEIPMIVAFNKIDKPGSDPEKVKRELSQMNVLVESYGGQTPSCEVSAKTKQGIKELLETIVLVAEMEQLEADPKSVFRGVIIESALDSKKGPLATLLVLEGVLKEGDLAATDRVMGKLRNLSDFQGTVMKEALPGRPVRVLGFEQPPAVGEECKVFSSKEAALEQLKKIKECPKAPKVRTPEGVETLNIILKTDVLGSCEAILGVLQNIPQDKVVLRFLRVETGDINASDVILAEQAPAKIFGFRVKTDEKTVVLARQREIKIRTFDVIYDLVQEVRKVMTSSLSPEIVRKDLAKLKALIVFKREKGEQIIGCRVLSGEVVRNVKTEIVRDEEVIGIGRIRGLQKDKKEIGKAEKGQEIGILLQSDIMVEENDFLTAFTEEKEKATL